MGYSVTLTVRGRELYFAQSLAIRGLLYFIGVLYSLVRTCGSVEEESTVDAGPAIWRLESQNTTDSALSRVKR